jgi:hypothetical protein
MSAMSTTCPCCPTKPKIRNQYYGVHILTHHKYNVLNENSMFEKELQRAIRYKRAYVDFIFKENDEPVKRRICLGCGRSATETWFRKHMTDSPQCKDKHLTACETLLENKGKEPPAPKTKSKSTSEKEVDAYKRKIKQLEEELQMYKDNDAGYDVPDMYETAVNHLCGLIEGYYGKGNGDGLFRLFYGVRDYIRNAYNEKGEMTDEAYESIEGMSSDMEWWIYGDEGKPKGFGQ